MREAVGARGRQLNFSGWAPRPSHRPSDALSQPFSKAPHLRIGAYAMGGTGGAAAEASPTTKTGPEDYARLRSGGPGRYVGPQQQAPRKEPARGLCGA